MTKILIEAPTDIVKLSSEELTELLMAQRGAKMVTIEADTIPKIPAASRATFPNLRKRAVVNGVIGWIYENAVNRQREREGAQPDFEALPRKWGARLVGTPLVEHKGGFYLEFKFQRSVSYYYYNGATRECYSSAADIDAINRLTGARDHGTERQELDAPIILRDYRMSNIRSIKMGGVLYKTR